MRPLDVLRDAFSRVPEGLRPLLSGLTADQLHARLDPEANTIAWLAWHLVRVQDAQVASALGAEEVWRQGWQERFALPPEASDNGYGDTPEQVGAVRVESADLLLDHLDAVHARTLEHLRGLTEDDLDRVVDDAYDPPVTLGARLVSIVADDLQHVGQIGLLRGHLDRAGARPD